MVTNQRRTSPRRRCHAEILISSDSSGGYEKARLENTSKEGMLIISRKPLYEGAGIYVRAEALRSRHYSPLYKAFYGEIRWCSPVAFQKGFGLGMKLIIKSPGDFDWNVFPGVNQCDKCGCDVSADARETASGLFLCVKCYQHITKRAAGTVSAGIENLLLGNVL